MHALFHSVSHRAENLDKIGVGILDAFGILSESTEEEVTATARTGKFDVAISKAAPSFALWRLLFGLPPAGAGIDEMYETEALHFFHRSKNREMVALVESQLDPDEVKLETITPQRRRDWARQFLAEPSISGTLRDYLSRESEKLM